MNKYTKFLDRVFTVLIALNIIICLGILIGGAMQWMHY